MHAVEVANKLGIEILYLNGNEDARQMNADKEPVCVENLQVRTILPSVICDAFGWKGAERW